MPSGVFIPIKLTRKARKKKPAEFANAKTGVQIRGTLKTRLQSLYIPPAYKNLQFAHSASNKIQVVGEDTAGRTQYIYNNRYKAGLEKRKYADLDELGKYITRIEADNHAALLKILAGSSNNGTRSDEMRFLEKQELIQIMIYMLRTYHFRIGCQKYAELYGSYGISTLQPRHFKSTSNGDIAISFIGKKGVENNALETKEHGIRLIKLLLQHYKQLSKAAKSKSRAPTFLFRYLDAESDSSVGSASTGLITSDDIQDYFKTKYNIYATPKMFRTWYANYHMLEYLRDTNLDDILAENPSKRQLATRIKTAIGEHVSQALNNTPAICRKNYINNRLLDNITSRPKYYIAECRKQKTSEKLHKYLGRLLLYRSH